MRVYFVLLPSGRVTAIVVSPTEVAEMDPREVASLN